MAYAKIESRTARPLLSNPALPTARASGRDIAWMPAADSSGHAGCALLDAPALTPTTPRPLLEPIMGDYDEDDEDDDFFDDDTEGGGDEAAEEDDDFLDDEEDADLDEGEGSDDDDDDL